MLESHHRVLPVADVVPEADVQDFVSEVEAVEVEPECVDYSVAFLDDDQHGWCVAFACFSVPPGVSIPRLDGFVVGFDVEGAYAGLSFAGGHRTSTH